MTSAAVFAINVAGFGGLGCSSAAAKGQACRKVTALGCGGWLWRISQGCGAEEKGFIAREVPA